MHIIKVAFIEHLLHKQALPHTPHSTHPVSFIFIPFIPLFASLPDDFHIEILHLPMLLYKRCIFQQAVICCM